MLGGIFYTFGGFRAPFFGIALIFLPVLLFTFTRNNSGQNFSYVSESGLETDKRVLGLCEILSIRRSLFGLIIQFLAFFMTCYNCPILNIHLDKEGFTPQFISLVVSVSSISYAIGIPTVSFLTTRLNKRSILFLGLLFGEVGWVVTGIPSAYYTINVLVGIAVFGISLACICIPVMPEILEGIEEKLSDYDEEILYNNLSGYFMVCQALGECLGPSIGSLVKQKFSFR